jgi:hypothetical protein
MSETPVVATYTATDLSKAGARVLDDAATGAVRIRRRGTSYMLMREEHFSRLLAGARDAQPQSLEDLLRGYDANKVKSLTKTFLDAPPVGKEQL